MTTVLFVVFGLLWAAGWLALILAFLWQKEAPPPAAPQIQAAPRLPHEPPARPVAPAAPPVPPPAPSPAASDVRIRWTDRQGRVLAESIIDRRARRPHLTYKAPRHAKAVFQASHLESSGVWVYRYLHDA